MGNYALYRNTKNKPFSNLSLFELNKALIKLNILNCKLIWFWYYM